MFDEFKSIIDTYLLCYSVYNDGKVKFECKYGELIFFKDNTTNIITIHGIYISPEYREKGLFRNILHYLIDVSSAQQFKYLCIQSVVSSILYNYLLRFNYENKSFIRCKDGFFLLL